MIDLRRAALFLSTALLTACLGTADDTAAPDPVGDDGPGAPSTPGTPDDGTPPPNPALCSLEAAYPDLGVVDGTALYAPIDPNVPDGPHVVRLAIGIGQGPIVDILFIDLWEGFGGFTNGLVPGEFQLVGAEADLATCGACVYMGGDIDTVNGTVAQQFHASGGTLTIDTLNPIAGGQFVGSISNVTMREVIVDPVSSVLTDVPDGCTTTVQAAGFSTTLAPPQ